MNKAANDTNPADASKAPPAAAASVTKSISPNEAVAQLKVFLGGLVNNNLEMAIAITHLTSIDLERMYADQLRYAELSKAQAIAKEIHEKNKAAEGSKPNRSGAAPEGAPAEGAAAPATPDTGKNA